MGGTMLTDLFVGGTMLTNFFHCIVVEGAAVGGTLETIGIGTGQVIVISGNNIEK